MWAMKSKWGTQPSCHHQGHFLRLPVQPDPSPSCPYLLQVPGPHVNHSTDAEPHPTPPGTVLSALVMGPGQHPLIWLHQLLCCPMASEDTGWWRVLLRAPWSQATELPPPRTPSPSWGWALLPSCQHP